NKKLGYIVVPLFIEQQKNETEAQALARTGFEEVAMVLGAMLENDDDLVDVIRELQEAKGRGEQFNPRRLHEKIEVIGPAINLDELKRSIDVEIVNRLGMGWDHWFGLLQKFHARERHCRVEQQYHQDGLNLGAWVAKQRSRRNNLSPEQIQRLDQLGFIWNLLIVNRLGMGWDHWFGLLQRFHSREGHCRVAKTYKEGELKLGAWVSKQRSRRDTLSPKRIQRLEQLGFTWDTHDAAWEINFAALAKFHTREGHCRVAKTYKEGELKLGAWVNKQRSRRDTLSPKRIQRLEQLGFTWDTHDAAWESNFAALAKFHAREGHCRVAQQYQQDGLNLGRWISKQRSRRDTLSPEQVQRLDQLGFSWDLRGLGSSARS
ncbi:MAG: Helicase associated domain protein, partial [Chthoniobacteraceae bacterium]|nr:Helicase associated domain protein [Chthoniobacteraceae bacterium]